MSFISSNQIQFGAASNLAAALNSVVQVNNSAGYVTCAFQLTIPTGATVAFQGSTDGTNFNAATALFNGANVGTSTVSGLFVVDISIYQTFQVIVTVAGSVAGSVIGVQTFNAISDAANVNPDGIIFDLSNISSFGTLETGELEPIFQSDFIYGLNTQIWNAGVTSGTGATTGTSGNKLAVTSGTSSTGYAYLTSKKIVRYRAGQGNICRFTALFTAGVVNNIQIIGVGTISSNTPYDGYFFGYNGTSFGIVRYSSGVATWTLQTAWNQNTVNGNAVSGFNWNPVNGTPVMIKYPFLGFGDVEFFVQNPNSARWICVHIIQYANTSTSTEVSNPALQFLVFTLNSGNTTNQTLNCGSVGTFNSGTRSFVSNPRWAIDNNKTTITTETCLINLQNCTSYNGITNRGLIRLNSISFGSNVAGVSVLRIKINATIGGTPSYTAINGTLASGGATITAGNSVASYDTAGTTVSGGTYVYNISMGSSGSQIIDLTSLFIFLVPGDIASITGTSTASATLGVSINWSEDI